MVALKLVQVEVGELEGEGVGSGVGDEGKGTVDVCTAWGFRGESTILRMSDREYGVCIGAFRSGRGEESKGNVRKSLRP